MNKNSGWISLHRKIEGHWIWDNPLYLKMWIYVLLHANHLDKKIPFDGVLIEIKKGEFITSYKNFARDCNCGIQQVRTFLNFCKSASMLTTESTHRSTRIKICNYTAYQNVQHANNTQITHRQHTGNTPITLNNNDNNDNKDNKERECPPGIQKLWIETFGRNPKIPEVEETEKLIEKFGLPKVKTIYREASLKGFKNLNTLINALDETGSIKPLEDKNAANKKPGTTDFYSRLNYQYDPVETAERLAELKHLFGESTGD